MSGIAHPEIDETWPADLSALVLHHRYIHVHGDGEGGQNTENQLTRKIGAEK